MKKIHLILSVLLIMAANFREENNVEGLTVKFRKVSEDYMIPGSPYDGAVRGSNGFASPMPVGTDEGMKFVKLKLTLKNEGAEDCTFDFNGVYISTEQDSLYPFLKFQDYLTGTKTKIKPNKEIKRIAIFEFPDKATPKELFIEDKRYKIIEEK